MKMKAKPSAWRNRVFLKIWLASLVSGTAVAAHETAATWMMNLMSPSGLFISLMASLASLPFFSLHASSRSARRRFQRGHNTSARQFVARRMCRSLGVSGLGRHPEPDTTSRGRLCARPGLCGQCPGMGIACATTRHRRRITIGFNSGRRATEYIGYSRARFSRHSSCQT
jgi:hypothetical protein